MCPASLRMDTRICAATAFYPVYEQRHMAIYVLQGIFQNLFWENPRIFKILLF